MNEKGGSIVSAASVAGQEPLPYNAAYGASKAAVISLTKSVAHEVAKRNIRVNGKRSMSRSRSMPMLMYEKQSAR